ncbi:MAG TPA: hypothetical protein VF486_21480, partial [Actinomycetes bacterium]
MRGLFLGVGEIAGQQGPAGTGQRDEPGHVPLAQPAKQQPAVGRPADQVRKGPKQRMAPVHLGVPVGTHHQQPAALKLLAHEAQQEQRLRVGPV